MKAVIKPDLGLQKEKIGFTGLSGWNLQHHKKGG
jgi:hypothetical protein